jgi:hypothetical protein
MDTTPPRESVEQLVQDAAALQPAELMTFCRRLRAAGILEKAGHTLITKLEWQSYYLIAWLAETFAEEVGFLSKRAGRSLHGSKANAARAANYVKKLCELIEGGADLSKLTETRAYLLEQVGGKKLALKTLKDHLRAAKKLTESRLGIPNCNSDEISSEDHPL